MNSAKTQMPRKNVSAPMRWIVNNLYFSPFEDVLHFGEGKAFEDTRLLSNPPYGSGPLVFAYDPNSPDVYKRDRQRINPEFITYAHGVSIYVFNTLLPSERKAAFEDLMGCCENLIIAVRTDKVKGSPALGYDGVTTKRGTFQTQLDAGAWMEWFKRMSPEGTSVTLLQSNGSYVIISVKR
jgi:hypothetical protein